MADSVIVKTDRYFTWASPKFKTKSQPEYCQFKQYFNQDKNEFNIRVGVVGSSVSYFGWDISIKPEEYPLEEDFEKEIRKAGTTTMILKYSKGKLTLRKKAGEQVWNLLYPFTLEIDPYLEKPGVFTSKVLSYESYIFGVSKVQFLSRCQF